MADQRLYRQRPGARAGSADTGRCRPRYADGVIDVPRARWIGVRESHAGADGPVENTIVAVDLAGRRCRACACAAATTSIHRRGSARTVGVSPGWPGTTPTCHGTAPSSGSRISRRTDACRARGWSPAARTSRSSSRNGRPTGCCISSPTAAAGGTSTAGTATTSSALPARGGVRQPQWAFGMSTYAFAGPDRIVCAYCEDGVGRLAQLDLASRQLAPLDSPFTDYRQRACAAWRARCSRRLADRGRRDRVCSTSRPADRGAAALGDAAAGLERYLRCRSRSSSRPRAA